MTKIFCSVEECIHNENKVCAADHIEVTSHGNARVGTSDGTLCKTFRYDHGKND